MRRPRGERQDWRCYCALPQLPLRTAAKRPPRHTQGMPFVHPKAGQPRSPSGACRGAWEYPLDSDDPEILMPTVSVNSPKATLGVTRTQHSCAHPEDRSLKTCKIVGEHPPGIPRGELPTRPECT